MNSIGALRRVSSGAFWGAVSQARQLTSQHGEEVFFYINKQGEISSLRDVNDLEELIDMKDLGTFFHTHFSYNFLPSVADVIALSATLGPDRYVGIVSQDVVSLFKIRRGTPLFKACLREREFFRRYGPSSRPSALWSGFGDKHKNRVLKRWKKIRAYLYEILGVSSDDDLVTKYIVVHTL